VEKLVFHFRIIVKYFWEQSGEHRMREAIAGY
jgi:hypothetical protein